VAEFMVLSQQFPIGKEEDHIQNSGFSVFQPRFESETDRKDITRLTASFNLVHNFLRNLDILLSRWYLSQVIQSKYQSTAQIFMNIYLLFPNTSPTRFGP
jgi:hypothetical protein